MQDLLPYSCFFENCNTPKETYLTAEKLLAHVLEEHAETSWICDSCVLDHQNEVDFSAEVFRSALEWLSHQRDVHNARIPDEEAGLLAQVGERRFIRMPGCPLCTHTSGGGVHPQLDEHILAHIHEFSLWALPENHLIVSEAGSSEPQVNLENETAGASELQPLRSEIDAVAVHAQLITDLDSYRYCGSSVENILSDLRQLRLSATTPSGSYKRPRFRSSSALTRMSVKTAHHTKLRPCMHKARHHSPASELQRRTTRRNKPPPSPPLA